MHEELANIWRRLLDFFPASMRDLHFFFFVLFLKPVRLEVVLKLLLSSIELEPALLTPEMILDVSFYTLGLACIYVGQYCRCPAISGKDGTAKANRIAREDSPKLVSEFSPRSV